MFLMSRSPHGERGLKYEPNEYRVTSLLSLPAWGAWIEIKDELDRMSLDERRSPHGERGLKLLLPDANTATAGVAPRMGSVD